MQEHIFEGKYELDSLAAVIKLAYGYFNAYVIHIMALHIFWNMTYFLLLFIIKFVI